MQPDPNLTFEERSHTYHYKNQRCISVSQLLKKYFKPFDKEYWADHVARRDNKTKQQVLEEWDKKAKFSMAFGTKVHLFAENYILKKPTPKLSDREKDYAKQVIRFLKRNPFLKPLAVEHRICSAEHLIAGTIDLLMKNDKGEVFIFDWKTNGKMLHSNDYGQMLLEPFDDLHDCEVVKYSLQLGCYKKMLELQGVNVSKIYLIWLQNDNYNIIKCPDYKHEVDMIFDLHMK